MGVEVEVVGAVELVGVEGVVLDEDEDDVVGLRVRRGSFKYSSRLVSSGAGLNGKNFKRFTLVRYLILTGAYRV